MQRKQFVALAALLLLTGAGCTAQNKNPQTPVACTMEAKQCPDGSYVGRTGPNCEFSPCPEIKSVEYKNDQYGFTFSLPQDWKGYSIVATIWDGNAVGKSGDKPSEHGPLISIRNPKWTKQNPYQDIPIMVFTLAQWDLVQQEKLSLGAAPIGPSELGRNTKYIFALPARYNFAFPTGYEEVQNIIDTHPLHAF